MVDIPKNYRKYYRGDKELFVKNKTKDFIREIGEDIYAEDEVKHYLVENTQRFSDEVYDKDLTVYLGTDAFRLLRDYYTLSIQETCREAWLQTSLEGDLMLDEIHILKALHKIGRNIYKFNGVKI